MLKRKTFFFLFFLYSALVFPSFYFVYKFGDPINIAHDFFQYYRLYYNWDWHNVNAPFNMRIISSFFVFLLNKLNIFYDSATAFDQYIGYGIDKRVFFNAILFNYLCVVLTCVTIYATVNRHLKNNLLAFAAGLVYILGFGTLFYELMPLTDSFSVLLFSIILYLYLLNKKGVLVLLFVAVFQREYILLAMGLIALLDYLKYKQNFFIMVLITSVVCFLCFFFLRKTVFYTQALSFQTSFSSLANSLVNVSFPMMPFIRQTLITLNIFIIYAALVVYKYFKKVSYHKAAFYKIIFLLLQIIIISFAAVLGNNAGRYFYILVPYVIFELARESQFLFQSLETNDQFNHLS